MTPRDRQAEEGLEGGSRLLTVARVAEQCAVSTRTVYRWIGSEGLPVHRIPGTGARPILRIDSGDLDQWLSQYRHDLAEEKASDRTLRLDGRRFIPVGESLFPEESDLDARKNPASRVPPERSRRP